MQQDAEYLMSASMLYLRNHLIIFDQALVYTYNENSEGNISFFNIHINPILRDAQVEFYLFTQIRFLIQTSFSVKMCRPSFY